MSEQQLPEELIIEILARSSMKDLMRFKCVRRAWRDLIEDPSFVQRYRELSRGKFVALSEKGLCFLDVEDTDTRRTEPQMLDCPMEAMIDGSTCVLHCRGMLCVTLKNQALAVWHPYSNEFKIIPNPGIYRDSNILGFGYDRFSDDYKIVTFVDRIDSSTAYIFDFKSDSWTESLRIPRPNWHYRDRKGIFLDQKLYWFAYRSNQDRFILCFSLETHEYQKLPFPVYNRGTRSSWLSVMGRNLCVIEYAALNQEIAIWVMEKTGTEPGSTSWNKLTTISTSHMISPPQDYDYLPDFVSFTRNNDILVTFTGYFTGSDEYSTRLERERKKVMLYKTENKKFEEVRFGDPRAEFRFLEKYVEDPEINRMFI